MAPFYILPSSTTLPSTTIIYVANVLPTDDYNSSAYTTTHSSASNLNITSALNVQNIIKDNIITPRPFRRSILLSKYFTHLTTAQKVFYFCALPVIFLFLYLTYWTIKQVCESSTRKRHARRHAEVRRRREEREREDMERLDVLRAREESAGAWKSLWKTEREKEEKIILEAGRSTRDAQEKDLESTDWRPLVSTTVTVPLPVYVERETMDGESLPEYEEVGRRSSARPSARGDKWVRGQQAGVWALGQN